MSISVKINVNYLCLSGIYHSILKPQNPSPKSTSRLIIPQSGSLENRFFMILISQIKLNLWSKIHKLNQRKLLFYCVLVLSTCPEKGLVKLRRQFTRGIISVCISRLHNTISKPKAIGHITS